MANSFIVSPMSQTIDLKPGETYTGYITVANPAEATENFSFVASLSPYSVSGDNYKTDFTTVSDWSRIVEWTKLENTKATLKPNETAKVKFIIKVPETAPAGGQYMTIGVSMDPGTDSESSSVQNVYEMASLVLANVEGETVHDGKILDNSVSGFVAVGVPKVKVVLSNAGNVHETATTTINIKNIFTGGEMLDTTDEKNVYRVTTMPDSTRTVERDLETLPQLGIFEVTQSVSYLGQDSTVTSIMVICPIWFIALVIATFLSILGMVFRVKYLRHKKKMISE